MPRAAGLAANILHDHYDRLPGGVTIVPAAGGSFEVYFGDRRLFSKLRSDRFPEENEVEERLGEILVNS